LTAFQEKFFPIAKTNALRGKILGFQQQHDESFTKAWERFQNYIEDCPHHGIEEWLLIQTFYHGLISSTRESFDAAAGGAFRSLKISDAKALLRRRLQIQYAMKNVLSLGRKEEESIISRNLRRSLPS